MIATPAPGVPGIFGFFAYGLSMVCFKKPAKAVSFFAHGFSEAVCFLAYRFAEAFSSLPLRHAFEAPG
jgi:hypothetical protein